MSAAPTLILVGLRGILTWLVYAFSGLLATSLSAPAEFASPLYLAAGVGLGSVLGWGRWMLLPVGLGAMTVVIGSALFGGDTMVSPSIVGLALFNGFAAAAQAWAGDALIARTLREPGTSRLALDTPRELAWFMLMAGPVACAVQPTLLTLAQATWGHLPWPDLPVAALSGWAGHTLGALVATPMVLTLVGQPRGLWRPRRKLVGVPMLVATCVLVLAVKQVQDWRQERAAAVFGTDVSATANAVNLRLNGFLDALAALNGVFAGSEQVSRQEFARASQYWIHTLKGIQAVGWNERVAVADLPAFEARQQLEGLSGFKVFNTKQSGAPAGRQDAVVVRYIEPQQHNERALGFNILSRLESRQAYDQASREGRVIATRGFQLIQADGDQIDVVVYHPVYVGPHFTPQERLRSNVGVVFLAMRMTDALSAMLEGRPAYLDACLVDATEPDLTVLAGSPECAQAQIRRQGQHNTAVPIDFAGRRWRLVIWNSAPVPLVGQEATTWLLAVGGTIFAAALGSLLLVMTGHMRRTEEAMEEARRQRAAAESANQAKSEFMSRMSHELRTPLNAVLGFAQLMEMDRSDPLPAAHVPRVEQIQQAGWHLLDMIDDVLDISRIDTGTMRLQTEPLRIRDELAIGVKLMQADAARQGVELLLPHDIPSEWGVMADAARLRQIISNLLSNAIKFNKRGGQVRLKVSHTDVAGAPGTLHIAVEDTGIGMSALQLQQLFQPFNRLGREQSAIGGTGIGLVVGRHLALLMGGQLEAQSTEDQGSVFTLSLPAVLLPPRQRSSLAPQSPVAPPQPTPGHAANASTPRPRHVLYVEDNLANSEVIRSALAARPWVTVSVAPTTEEGLAVLHNRLTGSKPDLILLDVHLPDTSGLDLLKLIKANPDTSDIPVIMISADAMPEQVDAALSAGANCYLTKPVQLTELLRQVDELMPA